MVAIGDHEKVKHFSMGIVVLCLVGDLPLALLVLIPGMSMEHLHVARELSSSLQSDQLRIQSTLIHGREVNNCKCGVP